MCVVARDEEGGVPRAVEERGGGQAKIGAGDGDGGVTEEEAVAAEVGEVGGGCVVAACAAVGCVYVLTSHAVELSFWSFHARRKNHNNYNGNDNYNNNVFGEWCRIKSPPLPAQVRVDSRIRFSCVGIGDKVILIQSLNEVRGVKEGFVFVYDCVAEEWGRGVKTPK